MTWRAKPQVYRVKPCRWQHDLDDLEGESWFTACGERFTFICDGPKEHGMRFCPYCGGTLVPTWPTPPQRADGPREDAP
jgi:hypothetical protein